MSHAPSLRPSSAPQGLTQRGATTPAREKLIFPRQVRSREVQPGHVGASTSHRPGTISEGFTSHCSSTPLPATLSWIQIHAAWLQSPHLRHDSTRPLQGTVLEKSHLQRTLWGPTFQAYECPVPGTQKTLKYLNIC